MYQHTTPPGRRIPARRAMLLAAVPQRAREYFALHPYLHTYVRPVVPGERWPADPLPHSATTVVRRAVRAASTGTRVWPAAQLQAIAQVLAPQPAPGAADARKGGDAHGE